MLPFKQISVPISLTLIFANNFCFADLNYYHIMFIAGDNIVVLEFIRFQVEIFNVLLELLKKKN